MAVSPSENTKLLENAEKMQKSDPKKAAQIYQHIITADPGTNLTAINNLETALLGLGTVYRDQKMIPQLSNLILQTRIALISFAKPKVSKLVRQLLDYFAAIPNSTEQQIYVIGECITWAKEQNRGFLRLELEIRLVSLLLTEKSYYKALKLITSLLHELKRLDSKLNLVQVQLLESRVYHELGNLSKGRAALTSARTSAASVYTPSLLQAGLDMQSGKLHAEEKDFGTAYSYFIEAMEGYAGQDDNDNAASAFRYELLCQVMLNKGDELAKLLASKHATKYADKKLDAMKALAQAHSNRSLEEYLRALVAYKPELSSDPFISKHLTRLYHAMLEQNLVKVIEPFSRVEVSHIAAMIGLDGEQVERKLSQMILDKVIIGVLDQGSGCLIIYDEAERDVGYDAALGTIEKLSNVVDLLYENQASLLE